MGMIKNAFDWGEPFVFGVPDGQDREFFLEAGLELGETLKIGSPESVRRYAMRQEGSYYGAHLEKCFRSGAKPPRGPWTMRVASKPPKPLLRRSTGWPSWPSPSPLLRA